MLIHLVLAFGVGYTARIIYRKLQKRTRLAEFARAKLILRNATLWLTLDYTLDRDAAKFAARILKVSSSWVELDELNFRVENNAIR